MTKRKYETLRCAFLKIFFDKVFLNFWNAVVLVGHPLPLPLGRHVRNKYLVKKILRKAQRGTRISSTKFPRFATSLLRP
jgi:hypothetical protein